MAPSRPKGPPARDLAGEIDTALRLAGDPDRAVREKSYLKSPIEHYGANLPAIRRQAKAVWRSHGPLSREQMLALVDLLWASPTHELRMTAVVLLEDHADLLEPADIDLLNRMIRQSFTWAYVDGLAASVLGRLIERHPDLAGQLDRWSGDENFWVRRAAMLALLGPLRRGAGDWERFSRYADAMLGEREFFIRKAIGWVLRETSKKRPALVRDYVAKRLDRMAPLTFREAVKRLPPADRQSLQRAVEELPKRRRR